jgi:2-oxoglutarate ferredoxin oxidoreductase subunit beta
VEIYQNCNVFNDGAFDLLRDKETGRSNQIRLTHGEKILFDEGKRAVAVGDNGRFQIVETDTVEPEKIVTHDVHGPALARVRARAPLHLDRRSRRRSGCPRGGAPVYGEAMEQQIHLATERLGEGNLDKLASFRRHLGSLLRLRGPPSSARPQREPSSERRRPMPPAVPSYVLDARSRARRGRG